ncbi:MAG: hemerythrin domain-containing protein [Pirellulaceae bacterium]
MTPTSTPHNDPPNLFDEHAHLREMLRELAASLAARRATAKQLSELLEDARRQLVSHFEHEESGGFFHGLREAVPHYSDRITELEHEHAQFLSLLDQMRRRVLSHESEEVWRDDCDRLFAKFMENFAAHESGEHELMQEAYSQDIGAKD